MLLRQGLRKNNRPSTKYLIVLLLNITLQEGDYMKRILFCILLLASLVGLSACSSGSDKSDERTLDTFITSFSDSGEKITTDGTKEGIDKSEKPQSEVIAAKDGVIFYLGNSPVKIYEYESEKDLKKARDNFPLTKDWPSNGKFLLESNNDKAKDIFNNVK
jgi:3D (Asp-Asp-Asp) domain-containing protein